MRLCWWSCTKVSYKQDQMKPQKNMLQKSETLSDIKTNMNNWEGTENTVIHNKKSFTNINTARSLWITHEMCVLGCLQQMNGGWCHAPLNLFKTQDGGWERPVAWISHLWLNHCQQVHRVHKEWEIGLNRLYLFTFMWFFLLHIRFLLGRLSYFHFPLNNLASCATITQMSGNLE